MTVDLPVAAVDPAVTTEEATVAKETAERVAGRIDLTVGKDVFAIPTSRLRAWVTFAPTDDGGYRPILDTAPLTKLLETMAPRIDKPAKNASFTTSGGRITGVTKSARGHTLDVPGTIARDPDHARHAVRRSDRQGPLPGAHQDRPGAHDRRGRSRPSRR